MNLRKIIFGLLSAGFILLTQIGCSQIMGGSLVTVEYRPAGGPTENSNTAGNNGMGGGSRNPASDSSQEPTEIGRLPQKTPILTATPTPSPTSSVPQEVWSKDVLVEAVPISLRVKKAIEGKRLSLTMSMPYRMKVTNSGATDLQNILMSMKSERGLLSLTGSSYPGTAGTCSRKIPAGESCYIDFQFKFMNTPGLPLEDGKIRLKDNIRLRYSYRGANGKLLNARHLFSVDELVEATPVKISMHDDYTSVALNSYSTRSSRKEMVFGLNPNLGAVQLGQSKRVLIKMKISDPYILESFSVSPLDNGFEYTGGSFPGKLGNCETSLFKREFAVIPMYPNLECNLDITFKATTLGLVSSSAKVQYFDGISNQAVSLGLKAEVINSNFEDHVLLVYNGGNATSLNIKDYYLRHRPFAANVNLLDVRPTVVSWNDHIMMEAEYRTQILQPVLDWLKNNPQKNIRYIALARGVPFKVFGKSTGSDLTRNLLSAQSSMAIFGSTNDPFFQYLERLVQGDYAAMNARLRVELSEAGFPTNGDLNGMRITHLDMGSEEATLAYIRKLARKNVGHALVPAISPATVAAGVKFAYYLDEANAANPQFDYMFPFAAVGAAKALKDANENVLIKYPATYKNPADPVENVLGFHSWGIYSGRAWRYAIDGTFKLTGRSDGFLIKTNESWNGSPSGYQGDYTMWFSKNAFGGSNYSSTPLAAVVHVEEPSVAGTFPGIIFGCWEQGMTFADCATLTQTSAASAAIGDPLVLTRLPEVIVKTLPRVTPSATPSATPTASGRTSGR